MTEIPRIVTADLVIHGVLKIVWNDGYVGVVDLRPVIARDNMFDRLSDPANFRTFAIGEYGHALIWRDAQGQDLDLGSGSLRKRAETQAELHRLAG
ncbi:MAG: DUF2442 domain-containing protein [Methylocystis sp.]|nr:DUF2442 domain-containing protein [Methylocystis sp.]